MVATSAESALVVLAPEAEPLVRPFRDRYDRSAAEGMPAHVTVLYPFQSPDRIHAASLQTLQDLFASFSCFTFALSELRRFPRVLYLAPEPDTPFKQLTNAVAARFPDTPPYGGAFTEIVPHLTVAEIGEPRALDEIAARFTQAAAEQLPIRVNVTDVALMDNATGGWQVRARYPLHRSHA